MQSDECCCFGFGTKKADKTLESTEYDKEKNLWVMRAYNGQVYGRGKAKSSGPKLHQGNRIRFQWNASSGDVTMAVDGVLDGCVFSGITEAEIFPAVASYGATGTVTIVAIEPGSGVPMAATATSAAALLDPACCSASIAVFEGNKMRAVSGSNGAVYATTPLTLASGGGAWEFVFLKGTFGDEMYVRVSLQRVLHVRLVSRAQALLRLWTEASRERVVHVGEAVAGQRL